MSSPPPFRLPPTRFCGTREFSSPDRAIQSTNDDATEAKYMASSLGYFKDDFVKYFVKTQNLRRRAPLINRGYFTRVQAIRSLAQSFVSGGTNRQILSLGAGFDTLFFILSSLGLPPFKYCEVDYPTVCEAKRAVIDRTDELSSLISDKYRYSLIDCDLKGSLDQLKRSLEEDNFVDVPTLMISECFLVYLDPEAGDTLIKWSIDMFPQSLFIVYEPITPNDPFGRTMKRNLKSRGLSMKALEAYPDRQAQEQRYLDRGYVHASCRDMLDVYSMVDEEDRKRIEKVEWLDELEEWRLVMRHYCLVFARSIDFHDLPHWMKPFE